MNIRDRVTELRRVPVRDLEGFDWNFRTHPAPQRDATLGSLAEMGIFKPLDAIVLPSGRVRIWDGHLRDRIFKEVCDPDFLVPCSISDMTEAEARKAVLLADPIAAMAEADGGKLDALLREVQTGSDAIAALFEGLARAAGLPPRQSTAGGGGDEFVPTPDESSPTRTRDGDVWVIGGKRRLLVGDCTVAANVTRLMTGLQAAMMFTDPPYGVAYVGKTADALTLRNDGAADLPRLLAGAFAGALQAVRAGGAWYVAAPAGPLHWEFARPLMDLGVHRQTLVWIKDQFVLGHSDYHYRHEPIFYGWTPGGDRHPPPTRDQDSVWEVPRPRASADHPTMKPVALVQKAVGNSSDPGDVVYDPFLGSGTTLVAAHRLGRVCYGCEIDPAYADVVLRRAEAEGLACEPARVSG